MLEFASTDKLFEELSTRCNAYVSIMVVRSQDSDASEPEYVISLKGAPHEILGLAETLAMQIRDVVAETMEDE